MKAEILPFLLTCFSLQLQYTAAGKDNLQNYNLVTDTPLYVTALQSGINASEVRLPCTTLPGQAITVFMYFQTAEKNNSSILCVGEI